MGREAGKRGGGGKKKEGGGEKKKKMKLEPKLSFRSTPFFPPTEYKGLVKVLSRSLLGTFATRFLGELEHELVCGAIAFYLFAGAFMSSLLMWSYLQPNALRACSAAVPTSRSLHVERRCEGFSFLTSVCFLTLLVHPELLRRSIGCLRAPRVWQSHLVERRLRLRVPEPVRSAAEWQNGPTDGQCIMSPKMPRPSVTPLVR
jgi:hypothetical protein